MIAEVLLTGIYCKQLSDMFLHDFISYFTPIKHITIITNASLLLVGNAKQ